MSVADVKTASDQLPWRVRYTWTVVNGLPHPEYTYDKKCSEDRAIDSAVYAMDNNDPRSSLRIVCAHVQAPGSDGWRKVEYDR